MTTMTDPMTQATMPFALVGATQDQMHGAEAIRAKDGTTARLTHRPTNRTMRFRRWFAVGISQ